MIALVDMNAFFASIEQLDFPELRGRPVGVTNGKLGTCVITCSYEARMQGIKTGMRVKDALKLAPDFVQRPARPQRYAAISAKIMAALKNITPDIEIFSVDEAFLDLTHCQRLYQSPRELAKLIKRTVFEVSGLLCSVGVSGDKTTAKFAAKLQKPNGATIIKPEDAAKALADAPVTAICGIARGIERHLNARNIFTCGDMAKLPISEMSSRWGNIGRRMWLACQGQDPDELVQEIPEPKSIGHGKVVPPNTTDETTLQIFLIHMCHKVGTRLRRHQLRAQNFTISMRTADGWIKEHYFTEPTQNGKTLLNLCKAFLACRWNGEGIWQVQVTALDPEPITGQTDMFLDTTCEKKLDAKTDEVMDKINNRYGEFSLCPAPLLNRSSMPNVISPAWKPFGHRETIQTARALASA
ncbi:MAG: DNA polymerase IV [Gammaproteobacteria bacterium]|nr:DNA polymerase IV [Gammaproteobacteria bacterium]NNC97257.1 DNA polymerase IV [Gammaproteobacteria bacterium]NNM14168.1 DNA polymerase IV [Gammaproteobacteria bacterium]